MTILKKLLVVLVLFLSSNLYAGTSIGWNHKFRKDVTGNNKSITGISSMTASRIEAAIVYLSSAIHADQAFFNVMYVSSESYIIVYSTNIYADEIHAYLNPYIVVYSSFDMQGVNRLLNSPDLYDVGVATSAESVARLLGDSLLGASTGYHCAWLSLLDDATNYQQAWLTLLDGTTKQFQIDLANEVSRAILREDDIALSTGTNLGRIVSLEISSGAARNEMIASTSALVDVDVLLSGSTEYLDTNKLDKSSATVTYLIKQGDTMSGTLTVSSITSPSGTDSLRLKTTTYAEGNFYIYGKLIVPAYVNFDTTYHSTSLGLLAGVSNTGNNNNFFGKWAGFSNTTGHENNFFGNSSGQANTTGHSNNFFGTQSGAVNTTGAYNNFFGRNVGVKNTGGIENCFFGDVTGNNNTVGSWNTFLGNAAGLSNVHGSSNVVIGGRAAWGYDASVPYTSYGANTVIGFDAGYKLASGSSNTFIGYGAGYNVNFGSGNIIIGYNKLSFSPTFNNCLNIGDVIVSTMSIGDITFGKTGSTTTFLGPIKASTGAFSGNLCVGTPYQTTKIRLCVKSDLDPVGILLENIHNTGAYIDLKATGTGGRLWEIGSTADASAAGGGKLTFYDGTSYVHRMSITSGGNVGIGLGTNNANELIEVGGDGRAFFGDGGGASRKGVLIDGVNNEGFDYGRIVAYDYTGADQPLPLILQNPIGGVSGHVGIGTTVAGSTLTVQGNVWIHNNCSALSFTDRTPYPKDKDTAWKSVLSVTKKADKDEVDHLKLDPYILVISTKTYKQWNDVSKSTDTVTEVEYGRNLSATVSSLIEVIKDLKERIEELEGK